MLGRLNSNRRFPDLGRSAGANGSRRTSLGLGDVVAGDAGARGGAPVRVGALADGVLARDADLAEFLLVEDHPLAVVPDDHVGLRKDLRTFERLSASPSLGRDTAPSPLYNIRRFPRFPFSCATHCESRSALPCASPAPRSTRTPSLSPTDRRTRKATTGGKKT